MNRYHVNAGFYQSPVYICTLVLLESKSPGHPRFKARSVSVRFSGADSSYNSPGRIFIKVSRMIDDLIIVSRYNCTLIKSIDNCSWFIDLIIDSIYVNLLFNVVLVDYLDEVIDAISYCTLN